MIIGYMLYFQNINKDFSDGKLLTTTRNIATPTTPNNDEQVTGK